MCITLSECKIFRKNKGSFLSPVRTQRILLHYLITGDRSIRKSGGFSKLIGEGCVRKEIILRERHILLLENQTYSFSCDFLDEYHVAQ